MSQIKFVQIATAVTDKRTIVYGLDEEGRLWIAYNEYAANWQRVEMPEEPETERPHMSPHKPTKRAEL